MHGKGIFRDIQLSVLALDADARLRCDEACRNKPDCPLYRLCCRPGPEELHVVLVSVEIANFSKVPFSPQADAWELVDGLGYSVGGAAVCERLLPRDFVQADLWSVTPQTRVRTMLAFPAGSAPQQLIYAADDAILRLPLSSDAAPTMRRMESVKGKAWVRVKKRGRIRIARCWSVKNPEGKREYVFIGKK